MGGGSLCTYSILLQCMDVAGYVLVVYFLNAFPFVCLFFPLQFTWYHETRLRIVRIAVKNSPRCYMPCFTMQLYLFSVEQLTQHILPCALFCSHVHCTYEEACFICYIVYA